MKVVLFCGGHGMRMRDGSSAAPKPMVMIGDRPLLWHVMRYYAHYGHTDFILCLGYGARDIKDYFLHYDETATNDFVLTGGGQQVDLLRSDLADWRITFLDTGLHSSIGERLRRVRPHLEGEDYFLANYADVLSDIPLPEVIDRFRASGAVASLTAVPPQSSFHVLEIDECERVSGIRPVSQFPIWENGGFFVFRWDIFDVLLPGEDLVDGALVRLAEKGKLAAYRHDGFWVPADTIKERVRLEELYQSGVRPWAVWETSTALGPAPALAPAEDLMGPLPNPRLEAAAAGHGRR
ncbi:sugar phosphate nucleotidyltransferase [Geodermatophilus sp. SYSU D00742]